MPHNTSLVIQIDNPIINFKVSNKRRAVYYEKDKKKLPKKYIKNKYGYKPKGKKTVLFDLELNSPVIANPRTAGTPKFKRINGQGIWNADFGPFERARMKEQMTEFFLDKLKGLEYTGSFPLAVIIEYHMDITDLDNIDFAYRKVIHDVLQHKDCGLIPNDDINFISTLIGIHQPSFNNPKIIIKLCELKNIVREMPRLV